MPGNRVFARASVSIMRVSASPGRPSRANSAFRKPKSNAALCAISGSSPKKTSMSSTMSAKRGLPARWRDREAVDARGIFRNVPFGVDQGVEMTARGQVVLQLQCGDFDHPVTEMRLQAGGFRVEQNGARQARTSLISRLSVRSE